MQIIDAHHHLWCPVNDTANIHYVWLNNIGAMKPFGDPTPIQRDYLIDEFKQESQQHELIASIHVQADGAIPDPVNETAWLQSISDEHQLPNALISFIDLSADQAQTVLERQQKHANHRGVRQILSRLDNQPTISFANQHYLHNTVWQAQYPLLAEHDLSFDLQLYPEQMTDAAAFFSQHPNTPIIIDHAGSPYDQSEQGKQRWQQGLALLAGLPHCSIKLSGFGMFDRQWSADSIQYFFDTIITLFGSERVMFGSNFPVDKLMCSYDQVIDKLLSCSHQLGLTDQDIQAIFNRTAANIYRLN